MQNAIEKNGGYINVYDSKGYGSKGIFALKIDVCATNMPDLRDYEKTKDISNAIRRAAESIEKAIRSNIGKNDPENAIKTKNNWKVVSELFSQENVGLIFAESIPNGYCKDWCCEHLPWFIVTTHVGRFKVGWRKRVIYIDWEETVIDADANELFPSEDVTKSGKMIHAWSLEDGARYVQTVINCKKRKVL